MARLPLAEVPAMLPPRTENLLVTALDRESVSYDLVSQHSAM